MNNKLLEVTIIVLSIKSNDVLAAAFLALTVFGRIPPENLAFEAMKDAVLIRENGQPFDGETLLAALSFEINRRADEDTFVKLP